MRRLLVLTGGLAWCGGMATMLLGGSCDAECLPDERPAVVLSLRPMHGGMDRVLEMGTHVTFSIDAVDPPTDPFSTLREPVTRQIGRCLDHACTSWALGADRPGRYRVEAELCGQTYETEIDVELDEEGCHVATQYETIMFDASRCDGEGEKVGNPPPPDIGDVCDTLAQPSAYVWVAEPEGTWFRGVEVDRVWYEHGGERAEAICARPGESGCAGWTVGRDLVGPITIFTEYCDREFSTDVLVERTENRCHADTEFVMLPVDTLGCLRDGSREPPGPDPTTPSDPR